MSGPHAPDFLWHNLCASWAKRAPLCPDQATQHDRWRLQPSHSLSLSRKGLAGTGLRARRKGSFVSTMRLLNTSNSRLFSTNSISQTPPFLPSSLLPSGRGEKGAEATWAGSPAPRCWGPSVFCGCSFAAGCPSVPATQGSVPGSLGHWSPGHAAELTEPSPLQMEGCVSQSPTAIITPQQDLWDLRRIK